MCGKPLAEACILPLNSNLHPTCCKIWWWTRISMRWEKTTPEEWQRCRLYLGFIYSYLVTQVAVYCTVDCTKCHIHASVSQFGCFPELRQQSHTGWTPLKPPNSNLYKAYPEAMAWDHCTGKFLLTGAKKSTNQSWLLSCTSSGKSSVDSTLTLVVIESRANAAISWVLIRPKIHNHSKWRQLLTIPGRIIGQRVVPMWGIQWWQ